MPTLTVTSKGQVTLRKELLQHLGVGPGDKVEIDLLPNGRAALHALRKTRSWGDLSGALAGYTDKVATLEEIQQTIEDGWAGKGR